MSEDKMPAQGNGSDYTADDIQKLEPREHVRLRPGMYVGGTDVHALHHLIYEVVDNSIDEALAGRCDRILIVLHDGHRVTVADNGFGIPVGMHKRGMPALELVMTETGAGGKFGEGAYKVSGGLHGVGVSAVNALSSELTATIRRDGHLWRQTYSTGLTTSAVEKIRPLEAGEGTGTTISFVPDFDVMDENEFSFDTLLNRFREMAFVTRRVTITLRDERVKPIPRERTFYFDGGLRSFVRYLNRSRKPIHEGIIYANRDLELERNDKPFSVGIEVAFQYVDVATSTELAFANTIRTPDGGTHTEGLRSAITGAINRYARNAGLLKDKEKNFSGDDTREGLTVIVSVKHPDPQFESQTKVKLQNSEVRGAVSSVVTEVFNEFLETNRRDAKRIVDKCMISKRARDAAKKARELVRNSGASLLENSTLPGKLADCSARGAAAEIYIVEGDSAGGSAKQGRDRHFQAILPLRGKILNTERARPDKILDNNEIKSLISALGVGLSNGLSDDADDRMGIDKLRYGRVIIMTDADVDGSHIRTLLLTFFFRHMREIVENGHLYIAQPPIYLLRNGKQMQYVYPAAGVDDKQLLERALSGFKNRDNVRVQRYKGLGEMNPEQLWETTMDPDVRTLLQVTIEDAGEADKVFGMLMGSDVLPRKKFIQTHAKEVRNIDF